MRIAKSDLVNYIHYTYTLPNLDDRSGDSCETEKYRDGFLVDKILI